MKFEMTQDVLGGDRTYQLTLTEHDLAAVPLDSFDRLLLRDISEGRDQGTPIADALLGLETIAHRLEEQP